MKRIVSGDRMSRVEFERRWDAEPGLKHAELLDGVAYRGVDGRLLPGECRADASWFVVTYRVRTPSVSSGAHSSIRIDDANEFQPTVCVYRGRPATDSDGILTVPPDLAIDVVSPEQAALIPTRRRIHAGFGTKEYLVWRVYDGAVDWFAFRDGRFDPLAPDADGLLKSVVFPGLWLDPAALVRRDLAAVLAALTRGLASPEHAAFVERLRTARPAGGAGA